MGHKQRHVHQFTTSGYSTRVHTRVGLVHVNQWQCLVMFANVANCIDFGLKLDKFVHLCLFTILFGPKNQIFLLSQIRAAESNVGSHLCQDKSHAVRIRIVLISIFSLFNIHQNFSTGNRLVIK